METREEGREADNETKLSAWRGLSSSLKFLRATTFRSPSRVRWNYVHVAARKSYEVNPLTIAGMK